MNRIKSQKGYALYLTLVLIILFTVLGMTILALTSDGMKKNNSRKENIQASALAEKGIYQLTTQINHDLTTIIGDGIPREQFISKLITTLNKYECKYYTVNQLNETGKYNVCIDKITPTTDIKTGEINELKRLVRFKSKGSAGDVNNKFLINEFEIGAEAFPETMKYAIGTNIMSKDKTKLTEGEGNLILHGGVFIQGDMKVDNNLVTYDKGYAYLGGERWIDSLLPSTIATGDVVSPKIVLGNKLIKMTSNPRSYSTHIALNNFSGGYSVENKIGNLFEANKAPKVVERNPVLSPIAISEQKSIYEYNRTDPGVTPLITKANWTIDNVNNNSSKLFALNESINQVCIQTGWFGNCTKYENRMTYNEEGIFILKNTNNFNFLVTKGGIKLENGNHNFSGGLYVEKDLKIGNESTSYDPLKYDNVKLNGNVYVKGDVVLKGVNLQSNAIMYVEGDVDIQYSTLQGMNLKDKKKGSLIIFAKGNIKLSNNSVNQDNPSLVKGFFYSEKNFEMFGVGSNFRIEGGISARRIILNALKGKSSASNFSGAQRVNGNSYFEGVTGQMRSDSRLQVIYDPEIIEIFSNLKKQEPIILKVDPPIEKGRIN